MNDKLARMLTGLAVLAVAIIAAIVSFSHIESLALGHGQPIWDARLLPVSVDGLLVVSSLTLLTEARAQRPAPGLARAGLVLGVIATVAANVVFGVHAGPVGAVISAWPAVSFIVATETLVSQMRRAGGIPSRADDSETVADDVPKDVPADVPATVPAGVPDIVPVAVTASTVPPRTRCHCPDSGIRPCPGACIRACLEGTEADLRGRDHAVASFRACGPSKHGPGAAPTALALSVTSLRRSFGKHRRRRKSAISLAETGRGAYLLGDEKYAGQRPTRPLTH